MASTCWLCCTKYAECNSLDDFLNFGFLVIGFFDSFKAPFVVFAPFSLVLHLSSSWALPRSIASSRAYPTELILLSQLSKEKTKIVKSYYCLAACMHFILWTQGRSRSAGQAPANEPRSNEADKGNADKDYGSDHYRIHVRLWSNYGW